MTLPLIRRIVALAVVAILAISSDRQLAAQVTADPIAPAADAPVSEGSAAQETKYPEVQQAIDLLRKQDRDGALAKLKEAKEKYDELPYAEAFLARLLFQMRDFNGALDMLKQAAAAHSDLPPGNVAMAGLFAQARSSSAVRTFLERAVAETPGDPEAYAILGAMALRAGQTTEAQLLLSKAETLLANFSGDDERKKTLQKRVLDGLAAVAQTRARVFDSQAKSDRNASRDEEAKQARAKAKEFWTTTKEYLDAWLKLDAKNAAAMQRLGIAMFQMDLAKEAFPQLEAAKKENDKLLTPSATMALLYEQAGAHDQAKQWMDYALKPEQGGNDLNTRLTAGQWAIDTGDIVFAKEQADAALAIDDEHLGSMMLAGVVALWQSDFSGAERYFKLAMLKEPNRFGPKNNLALALCEQDDNAKKKLARDYAAKNAQDFQQNGQYAANALSTYGWVLYKLGGAKEADKVLRQLISKTGGQGISSDTWYYFAQVAFDLGRKDEAKRVLESVLKRKTPFSRRKDAEALLIKTAQ